MEKLCDQKPNTLAFDHSRSLTKVMTKPLTKPMDGNPMHTLVNTLTSKPQILASKKKQVHNVVGSGF
jgi:hypothetical protein